MNNLASIKQKGSHKAKWEAMLKQEMCFSKSSLFYSLTPVCIQLRSPQSLQNALRSAFSLEDHRSHDLLFNSRVLILFYLSILSYFHDCFIQSLSLQTPSLHKHLWYFNDQRWMIMSSGTNFLHTDSLYQ